MAATVTTLNGVIPIVFLAPLVAFGFLSRAVGCGVAASRGVRSMPWPARVLSWVLFGVAVAMLGFAGSLIVVAAFGAWVALDAAAGLTRRDEVERPARPRSRGLWARIRVPLLVALYLAAVAAFHFTVAIYLPYGALVTWALLALLFALLVRASLNGPKAKEPLLRPPADHRLHERREEVVVDPHRARAEEVLASLRARGDAGAFLEFVREAARAADLGEAETRKLEERILASFARARTSREDDIKSALTEVEGFLTLKGKEART